MTDKTVSVPTESRPTMFVKNPIPIEAAQFLEGQPIPKGICFGGKCSNNYVMDGVTEKQPHVHTAHGNQRVFIEFGDWIVPEADGDHYYPIKPDVFAKTYRPAASSSLLANDSVIAETHVLVPRDLKCHKCGSSEPWKDAERSTGEALNEH